MSIVDFHTHAFPDKLAERAIPALEEGSNVRALLNGTLSALLQSMDRAGIEASVICSIATKPDQFRKILDWSKAIASARIIPFPSIHPASPKATEEIRIIHAEGFKGVKVHPYYQDFYLDEPRMMPLYEVLAELGLILVSHTGYDIAFPREPRCDASRIVQVVERFPSLKFVATHLGAWEDWADVEERLIGRSLYLETSFSVSYLGPEVARRMLMAHPADYALFGTDSPWADQSEEVGRMRNLGLPGDRLEKILSGNARRLLGLA